MSRDSKLVVTLTKWDVDYKPVDDEMGNTDYEPHGEPWSTDYEYARRDYARGPEGKAEFVADLIQAFESEGVTFSATGNDWAALPDGSYTVDYREGIQREVSMHFSVKTPAWVIRAVMEGAQ